MTESNCFHSFLRFKEGMQILWTQGKHGSLNIQGMFKIIHAKALVQRAQGNCYCSCSHNVVYLLFINICTREGDISTETQMERVFPWFQDWRQLVEILRAENTISVWVKSIWNSQNYASWEPSPLECMSHAAWFILSSVFSFLALKPLVRNELIINQRSLGVCTNQCLDLSSGWDPIINKNKIPLYFSYKGKVHLTRGY